MIYSVSIPQIFIGVGNFYITITLRLWELFRLKAKTILCIASIIPILLSSSFFIRAGATSWVYQFVVWDHSIYVMSEETVTSVGNIIGKVTRYSDMEPFGGNFSNTYPKGTKYYSIKGIDPKVAIAVQDEDGHFIKAVREGAYTFKKDFTQFIYQGLGIFAILLVGFIFFSKTRRN